MYVIVAVVSAFALFTGSDGFCGGMESITVSTLVQTCHGTFVGAWAVVDFNNGNNKQVCGTAHSTYSSLESCLGNLKVDYPDCGEKIQEGQDHMSSYKIEMDAACGAAAISMSLITLLAMLLAQYLTCN